METGYTKQSILCNWADRWGGLSEKLIAGEAYHWGSRSPGKLIARGGGAIAGWIARCRLATLNKVWADCWGGLSGKSIPREAYHRGSRLLGKPIAGKADRRGSRSPEKAIIGEADRQGSRSPRMPIARGSRSPEKPKCVFSKEKRCK